MRSVRLVLISTPPGRKAESLARGLVAERLAACVSVVPRVVSHYRWQGRPRREAEALLIVKTTAARTLALERWVKKRHPYSVPEILALPVARAAKDYLAWLKDATKPRP